MTGYLSRATFDDNFAAIAAEVRTLTRGGGDVRRRARIIVCRTERGETLAEVIATTFGPVVRYRDGNGELNRNADSYMPFRRGGWTLEPLTGERRQHVETFARSGIYGLFGSDLIDRIAAGVAEFTARKPDRGMGGSARV